MKNILFISVMSYEISTQFSPSEYGVHCIVQMNNCAYLYTTDKYGIQFVHEICTKFIVLMNIVLCS